MKSGYQFLMTEFHRLDSGPSNIAAVKELWRAVWHLQVPSKVKHLVWRAYRNSLPTKMNLVRHKLITGGTSDLCQTSQEDVHHAFYLRPKLTEIWQTVPLWNHSKLKQCANFLDLLECIFADNQDPRLFSMVIWALWNRRNYIRLAKEAISLGQAQDRIKEFSVQQPSTPLAKSNAAASWQPPARSWYKVNFDGALFEKDQCAGISVVIRNDQGLVMASLSQRIPLPFTVIEVEALAARRAVEFAADIGLDRVIVEGDSQVLIDSIKSNRHSLAQFGHIVRDVQYMASQFFNEFSFSHACRLGNTVAHSLARRASRSSQLVV